MIKRTLTLLAIVASLTMQAQDISLPAPKFDKHNLTVVEALRTRHSVRSYDSNRELTPQQLSNLCWAACGTVRGGGFRTAPTAMNRQEIRLFVFDRKGVYEYNAKQNTLEQKVQGDHRDLLASGGADPANGKTGFRQEFVMDAPVSLLMVIDFDIFTHSDAKAIQMGCVDAGNISQNINLYCQSAGLATVPRATMDTQAIRTLLNLTEHQLPIMNNPVGFEKK